MTGAIEFPEIPIYVFWIVGALAIVVAARYRLPALLLAGATPPGPKRVLRTAWVLGLDAIAFAATAILLKLAPFPLLMSGILVFGITAALLWVQWFFHKPENKAASSGTSGRVSQTIRDGMQGLQTAALAMGYGRAEAWVKEEFRKNRWRIALGYQGIMVALCLALRVLDVLQGGWLYLLFSLLWQGAVTGVLYWQFDRRSGAPANPTPGAGPTAGASGTSGAGRSGSGAAGTPRPGFSMRPPFTNLPFGIPGSAPPNPPGSRASGSSSAPGSTPGRPSNAAPNPGAGGTPASPGRKRRKFATRSDVQALVALSAGVWCGLFSRFLGWWYGFASVLAFRSILSLGAPALTALVGRWVPPAIQAYLPTAPKKSMWSVAYLRSREFWYGPGMGVIGGIAGAVIRHIIFGR